MRTGNAAVAWGREQVHDPVKDFTRLCLQFVRMAFGLPAVFPDAGTAWDRAEHKHRTKNAGSIPRGVPVFFELPSVADHVVLSLGSGLCLSNDVRRSGRIDVVRIETIVQAWGAELLGWTEDLNGVRVWQPKAPASDVTRVSRAREHLRAARRSVRNAQRLLEATPEHREVAQDVGDKLDATIRDLTGKLERLPVR